MNAQRPPDAVLPGVRATTAELSLLRRADTAGQRLFRELVVSRIVWATVSEASRLIAVDVVGVSLRASGCAHPPPCTLHHCFDRLEMKAVLGNRGPRLPSLKLEPGAGIGGAVLATGESLNVTDYRAAISDPDLLDVVVGEEAVHSLAAVPISFGGEVRGVLQAGLRRTGGHSPHAVEALERLCTYSGAALAAARDRARVEEVAALRERRRLARALHDELGQHMFGIGMAAQLARESASAGRADLISQLGGLERQVAATSAALKKTLRKLDTAPAPTGALAVTLREAVGAFTDRTGVPAHLLVIGEPTALDAGRVDLLVRIAGEALRNIERHAHAFEVIVTLAFDGDRVELIAQDDGVGLPAESAPESTVGNGVGIGMMREELVRMGGELLLTRSEDTGSMLRARLPFG